MVLRVGAVAGAKLGRALGEFPSKLLKDRTGRGLFVATKEIQVLKLCKLFHAAAAVHILTIPFHLFLEGCLSLQLKVFGVVALLSQKKYAVLMNK